MAITTAKQAEAFGKKVRAAFDRLGVKLVDEGAMYPYTVETTAGRLDLNFHDDWLACCFDDVERAKKLVGAGCLNRFSGKWNWHGLDCVPDFEHATKALLTPTSA